MTIELAWWMIPIAFVVIGIVFGATLGESDGSYDFVGPMIGVTCFLLGVIGALAFTIGYWLGR